MIENFIIAISVLILCGLTALMVRWVYNLLWEDKTPEKPVIRRRKEIKLPSYIRGINIDKSPSQLS